MQTLNRTIRNHDARAICIRCCTVAGEVSLSWSRRRIAQTRFDLVHRWQLWVPMETLKSRPLFSTAPKHKNKNKKNDSGVVNSGSMIVSRSTRGQFKSIQRQRPRRPHFQPDKICPTLVDDQYFLYAPGITHCFQLNHNRCYVRTTISNRLRSISHGQKFVKNEIHFYWKRY